MPKIGIQQLQLRNNLRTQKQINETFKTLEEYGYEGIELCGFMIRKTPFIVRILMALFGMRIGNVGKHDWPTIMDDSNLKVLSIHEDLNYVLSNHQKVIDEAKTYHTDKIVITGMHNFDYTSMSAINDLCTKLNRAGDLLSNANIKLYYHNHNCEFRKLEEGKTAFDYIIEKTNGEFINFELDCYWAVDAGVDVVKLLKKLGSRVELLHVTDRGSRKVGKDSSIIKTNSVELGLGNINYEEIFDIAIENSVNSIILESHKNWINKSALESAKLSGTYLQKKLNTIH